MRKRVIGVGAVILVVLGALLGFQGFGTGDKDGDTGESDGETIQVGLPHDADQPETPSPGEVEPTPATSETPNVLTLLIDDDRYLIQWGADENAEFSPSTLEEIVSRVKEIPGDENGVRVRLRFRENAQNGPIDDLTTALNGAGVESEAIVRESGYVD